jgi:hypothetical protein
LTSTAPPESIDFSVQQIKHENKVLLSYRVERVYPLPVITIYQTCLQEGKSPGTQLQSVNEEDDEPEDLQATREPEENDDGTRSSRRRRIAENDDNDHVNDEDGEDREDRDPIGKEDDNRSKLEDDNDREESLRQHKEDDDLKETKMNPRLDYKEWTSVPSSKKRRVRRVIKEGKGDSVSLLSSQHKRPDEGLHQRKSIGLRMEWLPLIPREDSVFNDSPTTKTKVIIHESKEGGIPEPPPRRRDPDTQDTNDEDQDNGISEDGDEDRSEKDLEYEMQTEATTITSHASSSSSSLLSSTAGQEVYTMQHVQFMDSVEVLDNYRKSGCFFSMGRNTSPVIFELKLTIPSTDFVVRKSMEYFPGE